ncbi:MAG TPA: LPS export ABC transporter permease LptF [Desulfobacteraceae bacterium]|nr:LPS export ABC transporter permease LptF [Desulfobacteraceae bacterium]HPJ68702.1 LPS export ABC transporter permease LptF [Desulfobacteraceae bacterium]HPQ29175.1 LPS export ABC transporter permease LptF [Desulfobacteraceae bacterium]
MTLYKYLLNEIWPIFFVSLFVSVFIILAADMLSITELMVNHGVGLGHVLLMVVYLLPDITAFALPAVSLMAVVVAFLRLSSDSEIIALKSCGISLYQMMPPVILVSSLGLIFAVFIGFIAMPWGNRSFKDLLYNIAQSKADLGIKERIFCEPFNNVIFYVNSFSSREKVMKNVFVVDRRDINSTNTIVAKESRIFLYPEEQSIILRFENGTIMVVDKNLKSGRTIKFSSYDLNIGLKDIMASIASRKQKPNEMSIKGLKEELKAHTKGSVRYNKVLLEMLERFSLPFAVFLMAIIGVPLGAQIKTRERTAGIGLSLGVFAAYYMCLAGMRSLSSTGIISPSIGVWIPVIFLFISCVFLLWRVANERSVNFFSEILYKIKNPGRI